MLAVLVFLGVAGSASAASVTIGNYDTGECYPYSCGYSDELTEWQQHFAASAFGVTTKISITDFVLTAWAGNFYPPSADTGTFNIYLSTAVNSLGNDSPSLASNIGPDNVLFAQVTFGPGMPMSFTVTGFSPFIYNPDNGDLLIDVHFTGSSSVLGYYGSFFNADVTGAVTLTNYTSTIYGANANHTGGLVTEFDYTAIAPTQTQTITFGPLNGVTYGAAPFMIAATASSGLTVSFASTTLGVCTVAGTTVTIVGGGTCSITASQPGNAIYLAATPVTQSFTVAPTTQTILFPQPGNVSFGISAFALTATASSGLAVSFASTTPAVCTAAGTMVTVVATGTCSITATQAGNATYTAAMPVAQSFTVNPGSQTITFGALNAVSFGATPFTITATASSGLPVSFLSTTPAVCTVAGTTVTIVGTGTCSITATQGGNANYNAATAVSQSFMVNPASQTITFGTLSAVTFGGAPLTISATASSGLAVVFLSATPTVCTISGSALALVATGTCSIAATQPGNANYSAAASVIRSFTITAGSQTISFGALSSVGYGAPPITLLASASSGLVVSFASTTIGVCTVAGTSLTIVAIGSCSVVATQPGNANYSAATPVTQTFLVSPGNQVIRFGAVGNVSYGGSPFTLTVTASSGLPVSLTSATPAVCTNAGATVTIVAVGTCSITATQAGNTNYNAAAPTVVSFTIGPASQIITFGGIGSVTFGVTPFALTATATSGLAVIFSSTTPAVCMVTGTTVTILTGGICSITAAQAGNADYSAAPPVTESLTVNAAAGGPAITQSGVVPLFSSSTTIEAGSWISIYGSNLASTTATWNGDFPTSLGGVTVTIDGKPAYLLYVSPTQINLQAPNDMATGTVSVTLTNATGSWTSTVTLGQASPSFSLLDNKHVAGIILRFDGSGAYGGGTYDIIGPTGTSLGYPTVAAKAGDIVELFGVGFGPTNPTVPAGKIFSGAAVTVNPVQLTIGGTAVSPSFAGLTSAGLYQFNLTIPAGLGSGDVPLVAMTDGAQTQSGVMISLQ